MSIFTKSRILSAALIAGSVVAGVNSASAFDRNVAIVNDTDAPIVNFYASNVGTNDWQEDIFGNDILPPGHQVNVNVNDGTGYCRYDFRAVFSDGTDLVQPNVNVCAISTFTYR